MKAEAKHLSKSREASARRRHAARKVETEIFRDSDIPKGRINVNREGRPPGEVEEPD